MLRPMTRLEQYLAKIAGFTNTAPAPLTRLEQFLAKIAGVTNTAPTPLTRLEQYLNAINISGDNIEQKVYTPETNQTQFVLENPRSAMPTALLIYCDEAAEDLPSGSLKGAFAYFLPAFRLGANGGYVRYSTLVRTIYVSGDSKSFRDNAKTTLSETQAGISNNNANIIMPYYPGYKYMAGINYTIRLYY